MSDRRMPVQVADPDAERISLCEAVDRVLTKGVVLTGEVMICVADVDLIWLGLQLVLTSVETAREIRPHLAGVPAAAERSGA
jgi:hypothetical protein